MPDATGPNTARSRSLLGGFRMPVFGGGARVDRMEFDNDGNLIFYGDLTVRGTLHADTLSQENTETVNKWLEVGSQITDADGKPPIRIKTPDAYTGNLLEIVRGNVMFARIDNEGFLDFLGGDAYGARTYELQNGGSGIFNARGGRLTNARAWETEEGEDEALWLVPLASADVAQHAMKARMGTSTLLSLTATGDAAGGAHNLAVAWLLGTHDYAGGSIHNAKLGTDLDADGFKTTDAGGAEYRTNAKLDWPTSRLGEWATGALLAQAQGAASRATYLDVLPKGTPSGTQGALYVWNLDPTVAGQEALQEAVYLASMGTAYEIGVTKAGAGTSLKPLRVRLGASDMLTFDPGDLSLNAHNRALRNLLLGSDASAGGYSWTNLASLQGRIDTALSISSPYATAGVPGIILRTLDRNGAALDRLSIYTAASVNDDTARAVWGSMRHEGLALGAALTGNRHNLDDVGNVTLDKGTDGLPTLGFKENGAWRAAAWYDTANGELILSIYNNLAAEVEALRLKGETSSPYAEWTVPQRGVELGASMEAATYPIRNAGNLTLAEDAIIQTRGAILGRDATTISISRDVNGKVAAVTDDGATITVSRDANGKVSAVETTMGSQKPTETLTITRNATTGKLQSASRAVTGV